MYIKDSSKEGPLHKACKSEIDAFVKVKYIVKKDPGKIHSRNELGYLPIHLSARQSDIRILKYLAKKCDINTRSYDQLTPLHIAAFHGKTEYVAFLLSFRECDINAQDIDGNNPLHYGLRIDQTRQVKTAMLQLFLSHPEYQSNMENSRG